MAALVALLLLAGGCRTGLNYTDPVGPRFAGPLPSAPRSSSGLDTLRIVSFNIENALEIDSALAVLRSEPDLAGADLILLQEMDDAGSRRIAEALDMAWVYYPAVFRNATEGPSGNAVLSRWPIVEDHKVILPHVAPIPRTQRIATAASIQVGPTLIRVYSVHLATPLALDFPRRRDQLHAVFEDASQHPFVVIGGDLNSGGLGDMAEERGYAWATREGPRTLWWGRVDHIFLRGFAPLEAGSSGTITDNREASDHLPVWAVGVVPGEGNR